jgi:acyl-CoA thioester hydrolase
VYEFHYELQVQVGHLNYGGHLGHDSVVRIVHEARVHMFHALGVAENNLGDNRTGLIMGDLAFLYCGEGHLFDKLRLDSHVGELKRSAFRMFHRLVRDDTLIALVETGLMAYDYTLRAIAPFPDAFKRSLRQYLGNAG